MKSLKSSTYFTLTASTLRFAPAIFQVLNSHRWLVTAIPGSTDLFCSTGLFVL